jgi:hypothetical protein
VRAAVWNGELGVSKRGDQNLGEIFAKLGVETTLRGRTVGLEESGDCLTVPEQALISSVGGHRWRVRPMVCVPSSSVGSELTRCK